MIDPNFAERLHNTIHGIQRGIGIPNDDPDLLKLKRILLVKLAELETQRGAPVEGARESAKRQ
jgi:hypothetical protein